MSKRFQNPFKRIIKPTAKSVDLRSTPVTWGIPFDEVMFSKFMIYFEKNADRMPWDGFISSQGTLVHIARNRIHKEFLKSGKPYLMMLDSDIIFPEKMVERLLAHNLPIVGGWYKNKNIADLHPAIYDFSHEDDKGVYVWKHRNQPGQGLEKVDGMGAGCWLMRRDVAEKLGEEPYNTDSSQGGEDLVLCRKLHDLGIPLHVDWSINCAHVGVGIY
jgi:hypothetical protein